MESLYDRLKALGVKVGSNNLSTKIPSTQSKPIEAVVPGHSISTSDGDVFVYEEEYQNSYQHGSVQLLEIPNLEIMSKWSKAASSVLLDYKKTIFLDTETSGLAGGTGTFAFMVGLGYQEADKFHVTQLFMRDPSQEPGFLAALEQILLQFNSVVTFNGKSFDIPLLRTRYILNGMQSPFGGLHHVDVLMAARKIWKKRLDNCRLSNLEYEILGVTRGQNEVPGWLIPEIYFEYLKTGNASPLEGIFYHNRIDILSLAGLFNHLAGIFQNPHTADQLPGLDIISLARLNEDLNRLDMAEMLYKKSLDRGDLPEVEYIGALIKFAMLYKRQQNKKAAVELWIKASEFRSMEACIELAKYFEHEVNDYHEALIWTEKAISISKMTFQQYINGPSDTDIQKRNDRLQGKINRSGVEEK
jgi:uncharacterized protein